MVNLWIMINFTEKSNPCLDTILTQNSILINMKKSIFIKNFYSKIKNFWINLQILKNQSHNYHHFSNQYSKMYGHFRVHFTLPIHNNFQSKSKFILIGNFTILVTSQDYKMYNKILLLKRDNRNNSQSIKRKEILIGTKKFFYKYNINFFNNYNELKKFKNDYW